MSATDSIAILRYAEEGPEILDREGRLREFENVFSVHLPEDYKAFLKWSGKTMLLKQNYIIPDHPPSFKGVRPKPKVSWLYGLNDDKTNLFESNETYEGRIPEGLITIGSSGASDQICLKVADGEPNTVWYWSHEMEVDASQNRVPDYANMFQLAGSFTEFAEKLRSDDDVSSTPRVSKVSLRF